MQKALILILVLLVWIYGSTQESINQHWHFGAGMSLNFETSPPIVDTSNINAFSAVEPAVISNQLGNLMMYSNGQIIFDAQGDTLENSEFGNIGLENIFAPYPQDPDKYYLFRSSSGFGVDYSVIDLSLNSGEGAVIDTLKEVNLQSDQSQLLVTSHENQQDYWLIIIDNNSGSGDQLHISTYLIHSAGITFSNEFSAGYTFAGWYPTLEEARISLDCSTIATSHKGHYLTMFEFNNTSGEITNSFAQSVNLPDSFIQSNLNYIEFSPGGEYLYVIQDHQTITRFDATVFDPIAFQASGQLVMISALDYWEHIKRGIDGKLYLIDNAGYIDYIENPNAVDTSMIELINDSLIMPGPAVFFPNTFSTCTLFQTVLSQNICEGDNVTIEAVGFSNADSIYWDIDFEPPADTLFYNPVEIFSGLDPGVYEFDFHYLIDTVWFVLNDEFVVFEVPNPNLGPDQTICEGDVVELNAGPVGFDYTWNTNSQSNSIEVSSPGIYSVLVENGPCSATDQIVIDMIFEPIANLEDTVLCDLSFFTVFDASDPHAVSYSWNTGSIESSIVADSAGIYSVTLINDCFSKTISAELEYIIIPPDLVDDLYEVCHTDTLLIQSVYELGDITWSNGDEGPYTEIDDQGNFSIQIDHKGCLAFDLFEVNRIPWVNVNEPIFPNIITPNNDMLNEKFEPFVPWWGGERPCDYPTLFVDIHVFNRWGDELIVADCEWDGVINGNQVADGVYYYVARMQSVCLDRNESREVSGQFTINR